MIFRAGTDGSDAQLPFRVLAWMNSSRRTEAREAVLRSSTGAEDRRSQTLTRFVAQSSAETPSQSHRCRLHYRRDPTKGKVDGEGSCRSDAEALQSFHIASKQLLRTLQQPLTNQQRNLAISLKQPTFHNPHNPPKCPRNSPSAMCPSTPRK